jgi:acetyl esterase/lipase
MRAAATRRPGRRSSRGSLTRKRYGGHADQFVDVYSAAGAARAVVAVLHGGFWRDRYGLDLMEALCTDLAARGYEAWNVEYRRLGSGGGWPATFDDVRAAVANAGRPLVTIGHSAGGHLALWLGAEVGAALAVSQAGLVDLEEAWRLGLSAHAAAELMGASPVEAPDRFAAASPAARVPLGVPQLLVHGRRDDTVPLAMSRAYATRARDAGDEVELIETDEGHFECLEPTSASWSAIVERLP